MLVMVSFEVPTQVLPGDYVPFADQRIVLRGCSWDDFETLLRIRGDHRYRMAYLDGAVEIMGASRGHEGKKSMIGCLLEYYCLDRGIPVTPYGSWHLGEKALQAAAEPDECYVFAADPKSKNAPDLAIEVVWTSGGIDKLEIYRRLRVDEVWFWKRGALTVYGLTESGYAPRAESRHVPGLDIELICRLSEVEPLNEAVAQLRAALAARS
jgi:Uma2 family endonuclease